MSSDSYKRFENLTFDDFRRMAGDNTLSRYEKIGFPNDYREGKEHLIFADILRKLPSLLAREQTVLDIGPGCSELPSMMINLCKDRGHKLILVDSDEMLSQLPDQSFITKVPGSFPECASSLADYQDKIDVALAYSILHYIYPVGDVFAFLDRAMELLAPGGSLLIGDIPNISKRKRFFASDAGIRFHQNFTGSDEVPEINFEDREPGKIDDNVVLSLVQHARSAHLDAYVVPQADDLPMANRREDILITKP